MGFGIGMNTDHTLKEAGQQFSVTRVRIRHVEAKALRKVKVAQDPVVPEPIVVTPDVIRDHLLCGFSPLSEAILVRSCGAAVGCLVHAKTRRRKEPEWVEKLVPPFQAVVSSPLTCELTPHRAV